MDKNAWYNFLYEIENLQVFALCKDFDKLSLEDGGASTSQEKPPSYGSRGSFHRFIRSWTPSLWCQSITEKVRAPFIELPRYLMDSSPFRSYDIKMELGFRFLPGQHDLLNLEKDLTLPKSFDKLSFLSNSLGLSYFRRPLPIREVFPFSSSGTGLRGLVTENEVTKILVEVVTFLAGRYGRFLVLVSPGVGCTVWFGFAHALESSLFNPLDSYDPFALMQYSAPGFRRIGFVERNDASEAVMSALENAPFAEITIPASGHTLKAVGLGVMVAFFLAVGLVPGMNVQI